MKIYKLDIDTSKPIRKVVQMQQNATGALSVEVTNDGWPIRNISCALYEGDTELSAYAELSSGAGYKIDVGDETKVVKFTAKSTPLESVAQRATGGSGSAIKSFALSCVQLEAGIYKQEEFYNIVEEFGSNNLAVFLTPHVSSEDNINIKRITITKWNTARPLWFSTQSDGSGILPEDELIVATGPVSIVRIVQAKRNATLSSYTYPAVGYYTDYALDTVIRPSENAHCYAEQELTDPEPVEPTEG